MPLKNSKDVFWGLLAAGSFLSPVGMIFCLAFYLSKNLYFIKNMVIRHEKDKEIKVMKFPFFVFLFVFFTASPLKIGRAFSFAYSSQIAIVVNGNVITNYDIDRRVAFLRLQKRKGDVNTLARKELVDEMLRRIEMKSKNIFVKNTEIDAAFSDFAASNHMTVAQLTEVLVQSNVTTEHFKSYIHSQIGWGRLISKRLQEDEQVSLEEAVQRMLKNGGIKPTAKEYLLHQVVFVIPQNQRAQFLEKRRKEANAFRKHLNNCETLEEKTKGMADVTVRNLGRILELQLPEMWKKGVLSTRVNRATPVLSTERGAEFLVVCSIRKVSNDRVAQLFFSMEEHSLFLKKLPAFEKKYMQELHHKAKIHSTTKAEP